MKTDKSSLARAHRGGTTGGIWSSDPGPPPWVRGPCTRKKLPPTWVQIHTQHPEYAKNPPPPKKGVPGYGGLKGSKRKIHWGVIFSPKMMILQGVGHVVPYLGVSYANDPEKGGYMAYAPALDLTTLFEVICPTAQAPINQGPTQRLGRGQSDFLCFSPIFECSTKF